MSNEPIETEVIPEKALVVRQTSEIAPLEDKKSPITAAQAKVEAVAALTMAAYEKAATLELTAEESAKLHAEFPDDAFQPGAAGKEHLIYIEHAHLRDRFNSVFGMGKWAIVPRNRWAEPFKTQKGDEGSRVYVEAMLVVRGCFVAEAVGSMEYYPHNASQNYGDAVEGAKTAAFRRCAKEFGVGLQAWKKEFCDGWWKRHWAAKKGGKPADPPPPPTPKAEPPKTAPFPTEASRKKMLDELKANPGQPNREIVDEYFRKLENPAALLPNEQLEELPLRFVPATKGQMNALANKLAEFGNGERAAWPYPPHDEPDKSPEEDELPGLPMPDSRPHLQGKIQTVSLKEGKSKKGPWSLWGIKINDEWINTFSNDIGKLAQSHKGQDATVYYEQDGDRKKAIEIVFPDGTTHKSND